VTAAPEAPTPEALRDLARDVARVAGELIVRLRTEGVEVAGTKSSPIDIVT
jgi:myo-inositol-1(or 4)-monophosphatase